MKVTEKMIQKRIIDWGLDPDDDEDYYCAQDSLYIEQNPNAQMMYDAMNDGVI